MCLSDASHVKSRGRSVWTERHLHRPSGGEERLLGDALERKLAGGGVARQPREQHLRGGTLAQEALDLQLAQLRGRVQLAPARRVDARLQSILTKLVGRRKDQHRRAERQEHRRAR
eukprot:4158863-Pleurochrysis_carterae.AAC.2